MMAINPNRLRAEEELAIGIWDHKRVMEKQWIQVHAELELCAKAPGSNPTMTHFLRSLQNTAQSVVDNVAQARGIIFNTEGLCPAAPDMVFALLWTSRLSAEENSTPDFWACDYSVEEYLCLFAIEGLVTLNNHSNLIIIRQP